MSYGIPSVCSKQVVNNFDSIKEGKINYYNDNKELIKMAKTSIANSRKHEQSLERISGSIVIIKEQTKKKGIFS